MSSLNKKKKKGNKGKKESYKIRRNLSIQFIKIVTVGAVISYDGISNASDSCIQNV